jgi:uncharacterized RDD family membrane protein YckC
MARLFLLLREAETTMTSTYERTSQFLEWVRREQRQIITPEGVPVTVELADYGERLVALTIDLFFWLLLTLAVFIPIVLAIGTRGSLIAISIALFIGFLVRNLYFVFFELAWRGSTPGKRLVGLRVIDRSGGPLLPSAVVARNLTREIEMFIPLGVLLTWGSAAGGSVDWESLAIAVWLLFFTALPFINRDRMRGGDLIAGTMVIALPKRLAERPRRKDREVLVQRATIARLRRFRAASARGTAAPPGHTRFGPGVERGLQQNLPQDRLDHVHSARRRRAVPAGILHRRACLSRTRAALRQGTPRQARAANANRLILHQRAGDQSNTDAICSMSMPSFATRRS